MTRALIFFALIFAVLGAAMHSAEPVHAATASDAGAVHVVHNHDDAGGHQDNGQEEQGEDSLAHHHCPNAWVGDDPLRIEPMGCDAAAVTPARYTALPSRAGDPLLEPPSA